MADRYTGRHIREARHGAWVNKKRSRSKPSRQLLPAAAALTITGVLIGGVGVAMEFGAVPAGSGGGPAGSHDMADYPPADRDVLTNRISRETRPTAPNRAPMTKKAVQPAGNGAVISTGSCEASYFVAGRCIDLSRAAFRSIASLGLGVVDVRYEVLVQAT